jgi:hypothetical protein
MKSTSFPNALYGILAHLSDCNGHLLENKSDVAKVICTESEVGFPFISLNADGIYV